MNALGGFLSTMAGNLLSKFHDDTVVDDAVNCGSGGHGIFKDLIPLGKDQVGCDDDAAAFITFSEQSEEHLHFVARLLDIADVIEDQNVEAIEMAEFLLEEQVAFSTQEVVHETIGGGEEDTKPGVDELVSNGCSEMCFSTSG